MARILFPSRLSLPGFDALAPRQSNVALVLVELTSPPRRSPADTKSRTHNLFRRFAVAPIHLELTSALRLSLPAFEAVSHRQSFVAQFSGTTISSMDGGAGISTLMANTGRGGSELPSGWMSPQVLCDLKGSILVRSWPNFGRWSEYDRPTEQALT